MGSVLPERAALLAIHVGPSFGTANRRSVIEFQEDAGVVGLAYSAPVQRDANLPI